MELAQWVKKYTEICGAFGRRAHLSEFSLGKAATEKIVSAFDDDYQISRYMELSRAPDEELLSCTSEARVYSINGFEVSHVSFSPRIQRLLRERKGETLEPE
jgi:hypothetical protein